MKRIGVAGTTPLGPEPEADERGDDEQTEQHPRALEAHADLAQSACTWTTARTPASSASPLTRTTTLSPADPLRARDAPDEARARRRACRKAERVRSADEALAPVQRCVTVAVPGGRARSSRGGSRAGRAGTARHEVGTRDPPPAIGMQPMNGLKVGAALADRPTYVPRNTAERDVVIPGSPGFRSSR